MPKTLGLGWDVCIFVKPRIFSFSTKTFWWEHQKTVEKLSTARLTACIFVLTVLFYRSFIFLAIKINQGSSFHQNCSEKWHVCKPLNIAFRLGALREAFRKLKEDCKVLNFSSPNHDKLSTWFSIPNRFYLSSHPFPSAGTISFRLLISMCFHPWMVKDGTKDSPSRWHKFPRCQSKIHGHPSLSLSTPTIGWNVQLSLTTGHQVKLFFLPSWPTLHRHEGYTDKSFKTAGGQDLSCSQMQMPPLGELTKVCPKSSHRHIICFSSRWLDEARFNPFSNATHCLWVEHKPYTHYYNTKPRAL